jgi:hypothetical protein
MLDWARDHLEDTLGRDIEDHLAANGSGGGDNGNSDSYNGDSYNGNGGYNGDSYNGKGNGYSARQH